MFKRKPRTSRKKQDNQGEITIRNLPEAMIETYCKYKTPWWYKYIVYLIEIALGFIVILIIVLLY